MSAITNVIEQRHIAAVQKAINRTLSQTYEVDEALDMWVLNLLQELEEGEQREQGGLITKARSSRNRPGSLSPTSPLSPKYLLPIRGGARLPVGEARVSFW